MFTDLREFLQKLETEKELIHIHDRLSPVHEIAGVMSYVDKVNGPALFFHQIDGYDMPIVANLLGTKTRLALAFGTEKELEEEYYSRRRDLVKPITVNQAPINEVVNKDKIDILATLPVLTHREKDVGPYITTGITVAKDPETGIHRMGLHRIGIKDQNTLAIAITSPGMSKIVQKAEAKGMGLEVAIVIGIDPLTLLSSVAFVPEGVDKFEISGALAKRPLSLTKCQSVDLLVPAYAEIVLEGELIPNIREDDGPFGDSDGFYTWQKCCIAKIGTITHRTNPIYHALLTFTAEDTILIELAWGTEILKRLKEKFPQVNRLKIGVIGYNTILQIDKGNDEEVAHIVAYYHSLNPFCKLIIAVDTDINPEERKEVEWAITSRCDPDRDIRITTDAGTKTTYCSIDATKPIAEREALEKVTISDQSLLKAKAIVDPLLVTSQTRVK
jgi:2,5-furandicarboxylate decarboxylase 1